MVAEEVKKGVQMLQYQINTLMTSNGQTPFCTLFIYLNEAPEGQEREDLALVSTEILKQRIQGIQNKTGAWVAPAFPKIICVVDKTNFDETKPYWSFMKLCAECTAKRMVPDYISEKVMGEYKEGHVYGAMGAVHPDSKVFYRIGNKEYTGTIKEMYDTVMNLTGVKEEDQFDQEGNPNKDINLEGKYVEIYDNGLDRYVSCKMMNKNVASRFQMYKIVVRDNDGTEQELIATHDHPLMTSISGKKQLYVLPQSKFDDSLDVTRVENLVVGESIYFTRYISEQDGALKGCTTPRLSEVISVEKIDTDCEYVYDVTTSSGHFMVNGIFSHNCRAFLSVWRDPETGIPKFWGRLTKLEVKPSLNCVNA